jgi:heterodisulfide reductase subunit A-like polyferredoxin
LASKKVCVVGAGISGMSVANNLSQAGIDVVLIEKNPYPGGQAVFYGCKAGEECVHCGVCLVREAVARLKNGNGTQLLFSSRPVGVRRGSASETDGMEIEIQTQANLIDWRSCIECGRCVEACPEGAIEKAPGWKYFVTERCTACGKCLDSCPVGAISLERADQRETVRTDGVVLAAGYEPFDPTGNRKWGFGANPRVITGNQMERLFFEERYLPEQAESLAFIQCVGSRNLLEGEKHCSRACCAYALRMAGRLKEEYPALEIDFYYMDIQHFGKDFERFWKDLRAKINPIASNPISVKTDERGRPVVRYESLPDLACREKAYDLVVLSNGMRPAPDSELLADLFDLDLNAAGFLEAPAAGPGDSSHLSIFTAGACKRPMRIDDCIEDAACVSRRIIHSLGVQVQP